MEASSSPSHRCRVLASPWPGVHATEIDSARHYGRHWHATYSLGVMDGGAHRSISASGTVDAYAGDIVCANPGEVHDGRPLGGPSRRWRTVYLEPEALAAIAGENNANAMFDLPAFTDARLRDALRRLLARMEAWTRAGGGSTAADALACEQALAEAFGLMLRDHSSLAAKQPTGGDVDLSMVCERLADAPLQAPTLAELAALAGIGKFQLLRRFKKAYGTTPYDWLLQRRADRARSLIRDGLGLSEAAACSGFADQSHMTRVFVRRYGFTPGAWRDAH
jgi:AraC-like DNA-binding protein